MIVTATGCGFDRVGTRGNEIVILIYIFISSTRNASRIQQKVGNGVFKHKVPFVPYPVIIIYYFISRVHLNPANRIVARETETHII